MPLLTTRRLGLALLLSGGLTGCEDEASHAVPVFTLPPLEQVNGKAPAQVDLPDDVKSDTPLPAKYTDLLDVQSDVRSQGERGVCTIFTSTAMLEHLRRIDGIADPNYSEQFLQWSQKRERSDVQRAEASSIEEVMDTLSQRGTVGESLWPYEETSWLGHGNCVGSTATMPAECFTNGNPPTIALSAPREKVPVGRYLRTTAIKDSLFTNHTAVAVGLTFVHSAWSYPPQTFTQRAGSWERGEVPFPTMKERANADAKPRVGHAVLVVGWDDEYQVQALGEDGLPAIDSAGKPIYERGFYIVKNSWGTDYWGSKNPYRPGYGLISYKYVETYGSAYVLGLPTGAALPTGGVTFTGSSDLALKDPGTTDDVINVTSGGPVTAVSLQIDVAHAHPADLVVQILHENSWWTLWSNGTGKTTGVRGTWNLSSDFSRVDRGGPWTLRVIDSVGGTSAGTLNSWSLVLK